MSEELSALQSLWGVVFGDEPAYIDGWFSRFYRPELTATVKEGATLAAAAYALPFGTLAGRPCAHIYAVGVLPPFRGRGYGFRVTNEAVRLAQNAGFPYIALHPAELSLFDFYRRHCGFSTAFSCRSEAIALPEQSVALPVCSAEEYLDRHERLLTGANHITPGLPVLNWFAQTGGRLYAGSDWCAAVEDTDNGTVFHELLYRGNRPDEMTLAGMAGSSRAVLCTPDSNGSPCGMLYGSASFSGGWLGLTLE